jgi:hypothetical protein
VDELSNYVSGEIRSGQAHAYYSDQKCDGCGIHVEFWNKVTVAEGGDRASKISFFCFKCAGYTPGKGFGRTVTPAGFIGSGALCWAGECVHCGHKWTYGPILCGAMPLCPICGKTQSSWEGKK